MSVIIGCDSFLALRNVRTGNLARWITDMRVLAWVDPRQLPGSVPVRPEGVEIEALDPFEVRADPSLERRLVSVGFARKCYRDPGTIWAEFLYSSCRHNGARSWRKAASIGCAAGRLGRFWLAGCLGGAEHRRAQFAAVLREHPAAAAYRTRLRSVGARLVVSFAPEGMREMVLIEAANSLQIPTLVMIRSRDNLTSKIPYLPYADRYAVWSHVLKDCLLNLYPETDPACVEVTGAPQFDRHLDPAWRLTREELFARIGLDPKRPLILYTMAAPSLIPHEGAIVQHLADAAHAGRFIRDAQLLVRGHPRMFGSNLRLLRREYPEARYYPRPAHAAYASEDHEADVVRHVLADEPVHLSLLAHQDVQVNVCGTMTIDSAIFDKPIVNVYYDLPAGLSSGLSVRRFYKRSDTKQMMSYGASRLAHDPDECIELINRYLERPAMDAEGRRKARSEDCGPLDGRSGRRTAQLIEALLCGRTAAAEVS